MKLYLLSDGTYSKIGHTRTLTSRLHAIQCANARKIEVVFTIATEKAKRLEQFWHRFFRDKHIRGEWFALSEADVRTVKSESPIIQKRL